MIQTRLKGMGVALITPFKEDESVDYDALMRLVDYQLQNNTDFLLEKLNCAFFQSTNTRTAGFASVDIAAQYEFYKSALCAADVYWRLSRLHRRRHQNHYFNRAAVHGYLHHPGQGRSGGAAPPFFHAGGVQGFQP